MCSQFENSIPIAKLAEYTKSIYDEQVANLSWQQHVFPLKNAPVITKYNKSKSIRLMSYSLIPAWSKVKKPVFSSYNARLDRLGKNNNLEFIYNAPTWRMPFKQQRCIVPLTSFFESCRQGTHAGNTVKFIPETPDNLVLAAGIWDRWIDQETGEIKFSFAIITDSPSEFILGVGHDRQPVFLSLHNANKWLDIESLPAVQAYDFLKQYQEQINYKVVDHKPLKALKQKMISLVDCNSF